MFENSKIRFFITMLLEKKKEVSMLGKVSYKCVHDGPPRFSVFGVS